MDGVLAAGAGVDAGAAELSLDAGLAALSDGAAILRAASGIDRPEAREVIFELGHGIAVRDATGRAIRLVGSTGDITDNDVNLAAASDAVVVGFNVRVAATARRAAESEGVEIRLYDIIYKLTDDIDAALKGLLEPEIVEVIEGRAEVRQVFRVGKGQVIAGSYVTEGRIVRGGARVWRGGKIIATDRIESLRRFRDDVREVAANYECGIGLAGFHDLEEGDIIECFTQQTVSRISG